MEGDRPQRSLRGGRCPPQVLRDKWHQPPSACWDKQLVITRSPFIAPAAVTFMYEDEETYEKTKRGEMEEERPRSHTVTTTTSSHHREAFSSNTSLSYDHSFLITVPGFLLLAEIVFGLLVWALIAGSEYFHFPAFGWVMFVAVFYWVLTVFFFIIYITRANTRILKVPWTLVGLCFNGSATVLYLIAAIVDATSITRDVHPHHNYNSWTASAVVSWISLIMHWCVNLFCWIPVMCGQFFAFLVTLSYAGSTYFSFQSWRTRS